ncbi:50S ribosomal protein L31 [Candidatus Peribacteria bacterium RIFCSPLOWO2_12_FULL_53_10]|nr:MAG: 50S ribosomal protein L31 [Candidatus Peribacteria bacterium RIFCSPLOWO2_12_FULL_53_10]
MKKGLHPPVFKDSTTTCSTCGVVYAITSTVQTMQIEVCRGCHPVYTGKKQVDARGGRVERFRKRLEKTGATK